MSRMFPRARMHGRATAIVLVLLIAAAAALVIVHVLRRRAAAERALASAPAPASTAVHAPGHVRSMGHAQLLAAASRALTQHRLLAPAGDNAFAYYLEARKRQPHNPVAAAALRELFPFAVQSVEQTINAGHVDEAQRQIDLLDRADPANYSLNILRAKLDARRRVAQVPTSPTPEPKSISSSKPVPRVASHAPVADLSASAPEQPQEPSVALKPRHHAPAPKPAPASPTRSQQQVTQRTPPLLLRNVRPAYPAAARLAHRQGWVDVAYTVDRDGRVEGARVVDAHPTHVFDIAALSAVRHWEFKPAQRDGHAVAQKVRSRIEFKL